MTSGVEQTEVERVERFGVNGVDWNIDGSGEEMWRGDVEWGCGMGSC